MLMYYIDMYKLIYNPEKNGMMLTEIFSTRNSK